MKDYYLPRGDKERSVWLKNFALKFAGVATTLGFTAAEATAVTNDSNAFAYMLDLLEVFKTEARERTAYKDILIDGPLGAALGAIPAAPTIPAPPTAVPAGCLPPHQSHCKAHQSPLQLHRGHWQRPGYYWG